MICYRCQQVVRQSVRACRCGSVAFYHATEGRETGHLSKTLDGLGEKDRERRDDIDALLRLGARLRGMGGLTARRHQRR